LTIEQEESYKKLHGTNLVIRGKIHYLHYDTKRRCLRLYPKKGKDTISKKLDPKIAYFIAKTFDEASKEDGLYVQEVNLPFPRSSYWTLDARALKILLDENGAQTIISKKKGASVKNFEIKTAKITNEVGSEIKYYSIPKEFAADSIANKSNPKKCHFVNRKYSFLKYMVLNSAMLDHFEGIDQSTITLFEEEFKIKKDGLNFKLIQINSKGKEINCDPVIAKKIAAIQDIPPEETIQNDRILINQERWDEDYKDQFDNDQDFDNEVKKVSKFEIDEGIKIAKLKDDNDLDPGTRIWFGKDGSLKVCIDSKNNIVLTADTTENKEALSSYLKGEAMLRRGESWKVPVVPKWYRKFEFQKDNESGLVLVIDGADDAAVAINNTGLPRQLEASIQAFIIFPAFLALVKLGVDGLSEEKHDKAEEVAELEHKIAKFEDEMAAMAERKVEDLEMDDLKNMLELMQDLSSSMKDLSNAKIEADAAAKLGSPAMVGMFSAVAAYQINSFLDVFAGEAGIHVLTTGIGDVLGIDTIPNVAARVGLLSIGGDALAFIGQCLMTLYAKDKATVSNSEFGKINEEIKSTKSSKIISEQVKEILIGVKKQQRFYASSQVAGNAALSSGQAMMAIFGPVMLGLDSGVLTGLGLTLGGVGLNSYAAIYESTKFSHNEEQSDLEEKLSEHFGNKLAELALSKMKKDNLGDQNYASHSDIQKLLQDKAYTFEYLMHLNSVNLVVGRIFKGVQKQSYGAVATRKFLEIFDHIGYLLGDLGKAGEVFDSALDVSQNNQTFNRGIKKAKNHYGHSSNKHQVHLLELTKEVEKNKATFEEQLNNSKALGEYGYALVWKEFSDSFSFNKDDQEQLIKTGSYLQEYDLGGDNEKKIILKELGLLPEKSKPLPSHKELIITLQIARFTKKVVGLKDIVERNKSKSDKEKLDDFNQSFKGSASHKIFLEGAAQEKYNKGTRRRIFPKLFRVRGAKQRGDYKSEMKSSLNIIGQVKKKGGKNWVHFSRKKNIYDLNPERMGTKEDSFVPSKKVIRKVMSDDKHKIRSLTMRSLIQGVESSMSYAESLQETQTMLSHVSNKSSKELKEIIPPAPALEISNSTTSTETKSTPSFFKPKSKTDKENLPPPAPALEISNSTTSTETKSTPSFFKPKSKTDKENLPPSLEIDRESLFEDPKSINRSTPHKYKRSPSNNIFENKTPSSVNNISQYRGGSPNLIVNKIPNVGSRSNYTNVGGNSSILGLMLGFITKAISSIFKSFRNLFFNRRKNIGSLSSNAANKNVTSCLNKGVKKKISRAKSSISPRSAVSNFSWNSLLPKYKGRQKG
jgi:hypothetical protein